MLYFIQNQVKVKLQFKFIPQYLLTEYFHPTTFKKS